MDEIRLNVFGLVKNGVSTRITRLIEDGGRKTYEIFHEFDGFVPWSTDQLRDGHALLGVLYAAARGKKLAVTGSISRAALRNMKELMSAWSRWKPDIYKNIEITADRIVDAPDCATGERAISAFSGGVDATFTALRHAAATQEICDGSNYPLCAALLVHGFDVDVYNTADFRALLRRVQPFIDMVGLNLRTIRTNSRDLRLVDWEDACGIELAACLHMYSQEYNVGLIGSSNPYDELDLPWGSNPVTDHLMGGAGFKVVHDGAGFSRTEKVQAIMRYPKACKSLKVCWAGADQSRNCGHCEKCVRTQLNFLAAGASKLPECFDDPFDADNIRRIRIEGWAQMVEFYGIRDFAKTHKSGGDWLPILQERIAAWSDHGQVRSGGKGHGLRLKRWVADAVAIAGATHPVTKVWRQMRRTSLKIGEGFNLR